MPGVLLFVLYLGLFNWAIFRHPFFRQLGLNNRYWIPALFCLKVAAGAGYAWLFSHQPQYEVRVDTWRYFYESLPEKDWLLSNPQSFFADLFSPRYAQDSGILGTQNSLLNDAKEVLMIKLSAIFNLFSGSRYYINLIFFNYIVLFGQVALAAVWARFFQMSNARWMTVGIILWPSILFWSSGFHRDGLMLHAMGWIIWLLYQLYTQRKKWLWRLLVMLAYISLLFVMRSYLALLLLLAIGFGGLANVLPPRAVRWALPVIVVALCMGVFVVGKWKPNYALPELLAGRQQEFLKLDGQSKVEPLPLSEGWIGLLRSVPEALHRAFASPLPARGLKPLEWPPAIENTIWLICLLPAVWASRKLLHTPLRRAWVMLVLVLVLSTALLTGLTIPFIGAIARYKSLWWPFMLPPILYWFSLMVPPGSRMGKFFSLSTQPMSRG